jgi:tetratricopeptide (TPR) repeat protein
MTDPEKLIVYYSMILFLHKDYDNALNLLNRFAKDIHGNIIYEANIQRILGLIHFNKVEINESMGAFKIAEGLYRQANSKYGMALCQYSMGVIMQSNYASLLKKPEPSKFSLPIENTSDTFTALRHFENALDLFSENLNHKVGMSLCHEHLASIYKGLGNTNRADFHADLKLSLHT